MNRAFPTTVLSLALPLADLQSYSQSALALWGRLLSATQTWAKAPPSLQEAVLVATGIAGTAALLMFVYIVLLRIRARRETQTFQQELAKLAAVTQAAVSANQAKAEFLTSMSHRIRTAMNAIVGFTDLALKPDFDPALREYLDAVRRSADWAIHIANDVLEFSRIEAGRMQLDSVPFSISECVFSAMKIVEREASAKKVAITCEIDPKLPEVVCGDPAQLRHVILNLLEHAVRFTTSGSVILSAALESNSTDDILIRVAVTGTSVGIPPTKQPLIFEPFQSADAGVALRSGTTSLGLAISRRLVGLMGGTMDLQSQLGAGSTFDFTARFRKQKTAAQILTLVHAPESVGLKELSILVAGEAHTEPRPSASGGPALVQTSRETYIPEAIAASSALVAEEALTEPRASASGGPALVQTSRETYIPEAIAASSTLVAEEALTEPRASASGGPSVLQTSTEADIAEAVAASSTLVDEEALTEPRASASGGPSLLQTSTETNIAEAVAASSTDSPDDGETWTSPESSPYWLPSVSGVETNGFSGATALAINLEPFNPTNIEIEGACDVLVDAEEQPLIADSDEIVDSDKRNLREANQSAEIISILAGMEASYGNSHHREMAQEAQLSAPAGLALLEANCQLTQQSPSPAKKDECPTLSPAWDPFEQARKSLSKSRFDVRVIHNDGDPSDRNLI